MKLRNELIEPDAVATCAGELQPQPQRFPHGPSEMRLRIDPIN